MAVKFTNNAASTISDASGINDSVTSVTLASGDGNAMFPDVTSGAGDYFLATLIDDSGNIEIVKCTNRSADVLTIARGQEGTTARAFAAGDSVEVRLTAGFLNSVSSAAPTLPFYRADGTSDTIVIVSHELPFYKADGTQDNIGV